MSFRDPLHDVHDELVVVDGDVRLFIDRGALVLVGCHLVVAGLERDAELEALVLEVHHEGQHAILDRAEVMVLKLLALRGSGPEQGAAREQKVGARVVVLLVDQEVFLLGAEGRDDLLRVALEQRQDAESGVVEHGDRTQERRLGIQGVPGI